MKKVLLGGLVCTLFLTGCGGKTLTCTRSEEESGMKVSEEIKLTFDKEGKEVNKGSFKAQFEVSEEYSSKMSDFEEYVKEEFAEVEENGAKVKIETKSNKLTVGISYDASKLTEDQKDELYYDDLYYDGSYDEAKEDLEDSGYTCK